MLAPRPARVWDLPLRVFHWTLGIGVAAAFVGGGDVGGTDLHTWLGTSVAGLLVFRFAWGFFGERWSRWSSFPLTRAARRAHTADTPGHPPSGALSAVFVLGLLALVAASGAVVLGGEERRGPLAGWVTAHVGLDAHAAHEVLAWILPFWLVAHVGGAVLHGRRVGRPVVRAMVTGASPGPHAPVADRAPVALALVAALAAGAGFAFVPTRAPVAPLAADPTWSDECGACHLAFHPSTLPARAWERMLATQADHFGEDLALAPDALAQLQAFARANAAEQGATELAARVAREVPPDAAPQRITETATWRSAHAALDEAAFAAPEVGSRLRCGACHPDAEAGTFEGPRAAIPAPSPPTAQTGS